MKNPATITVGNPTLQGLPMTSEHPAFWNGAYPNYFPGYEVKFITLAFECEILLVAIIILSASIISVFITPACKLH